MATKKKMLQAAAGQAGGAGLDVTEVFSTYLYTGNGSTQTITNDIDLAGEGGLVWLKARGNVGQSNWLYDDQRSSFSAGIRSDRTSAEYDPGNSITGVSSDGFSLGAYSEINTNTVDYASWTFRKAPKFFDVVTYAGNGVSGRAIPHNLGTDVGMIIVKWYDGTQNWAVWHRTLTAGKFLLLNGTNAENTNSAIFTTTAPTSTEFYVGSDYASNGTGANYVAYLFAHNDGDGEFGPDGDQDIIKCGSYLGDGSNTGPLVDLGWEPQWLLIKNVTEGGDWYLIDAMRSGKAFQPGNLTDNNSLAANKSNAELVGQADVGFTPTGFGVSGSTLSNSSAGVGNTYIYIAIRRGPLAPPESGTEVFDVDTRTVSSGSTPSFESGFITDFAIKRVVNLTTDWYASTRLTQDRALYPNLTDAEISSINMDFDYMTGFGSFSANSNDYSWMWKRAPGFFDVVAYTGSNSDLNVSHNLGAVPEMMWVKCRSGFTENWTCYHKDLGNTKEIKLNTTGVPVTSSVWANTTPTESVFTVDGDNVPVSKANTPYIAYLFASLDGISKVGNYTGNGGTLTVDCGFTSGARFVLFRNITATNGDWTLADTARGIVSGNDSALNLNDTSAAITNEDFIDPHSSGFTVVDASGFVDSNTNGHTYLFYAIA